MQQPFDAFRIGLHAYDCEHMVYQLGWTTLPGLRGLSVSDFRLTPTKTPDRERGVALELASEEEREMFLKEIEAEFSARRFMNAADAFETVKAWVVEQTARSIGGDSM